MVHPYALALLHGDSIGTIVRLGLPEVDVPDDDIAGADAENANLVHHKIIRADEREVAHILDIEPGMVAGKVAAVIALESTTEPDGYGRVVAFLFALGPLQEPGLEGLAVIEVQDLGATPLSSGHILAIAAKLVQGNLSYRWRDGTRQFVSLTRDRLGTGILTGILTGIFTRIFTGILSGILSRLFSGIHTGSFVLFFTRVTTRFTRINNNLFRLLLRIRGLILGFITPQQDKCQECHQDRHVLYLHAQTNYSVTPCLKIAISRMPCFSLLTGSPLAAASTNSMKRAATSSMASP